jgi:hypothetical protein
VSSRIGLAGGVVCVAVTFGVLLYQAPRTFDSLNRNAGDNAWRTRLDRLVAPGNFTGIDEQFQEHALALVPRDATFTVVPPPSPEVAEKDYGMNAITQEGLALWLRYLLMPARETDPGSAQYVLCYGCDTRPWDAVTTWLWISDRGLSTNVRQHGLRIGRVRAL